MHLFHLIQQIIGLFFLTELLARFISLSSLGEKKRKDKPCKKFS